MRFKDKVALVTGGNSGIGRGIVRRFVKEGARVALAGRDKAKGADTLAEMKALGADAEFYPIDLGVEADVQAMVEAVAKRFGRLDVVVNN
ncbi:MAG TPA: SDR family NAD(P)-dependent oxidoreductase, partial [Dongiaceae bacterium]